MQEERLTSPVATRRSLSGACYSATVLNRLRWSGRSEGADGYFYQRCTKSFGISRSHSCFRSSWFGEDYLANIIANELKVAIKSTSGPVLEKAGDLAAMLTNLEKGSAFYR